MVGQLGPAPEPDAPRSSGCTAIVGALDDGLALVLGHGTQERDEPATQRCGEVEVRLIEHLDEGVAPAERSIMAMPSNIDRVARSHSATTRQSPRPSWSIAFSGCGRFLMSLPLAFSR